jgi:lipid A 3-O-deacylase
MKMIREIAVVLSLTTTIFAHADTLGFAIGSYDVDGSNSATDFRVDYEFSNSVILENLNPWVGAEATTDGTIWLGGGVLYDWKLTETWHIKPGVGAGYYSRGSSDLDLGYPIEFRTQLEVVKDINQNNGIGLAISHLSNADLDKRNPGTEALNVYWHYSF